MNERGGVEWKVQIRGDEGKWLESVWSSTIPSIDFSLHVSVYVPHTQEHAYNPYGR
jgi:hypothetical protein